MEGSDLANFIVNQLYMLDRFCNIACSRFSFGPNHRTPFFDPSQSFAKILRTINEGCREIPFPYMSLFIRWCQYLTLIYHIDTNFLEKMSLRNVANSTFCHDWDSDLINYLPDHINTRSPRNAPQFSYVIW